MPAAYQCAAPFGADIGGVSPAFFPIANNAEFDSWLTVGVTDGSAPGAIAASPGLGLDAWTDTAPFYTDNGAIFFMDPTTAPTDRTPIVMMQITVPTADYNAGGQCHGVLQGKSEADAEDWQGQITTWDYP